MGVLQRTVPGRRDPTAGDRTWSQVYRWRILATVHTGVTRVGYFLLWVVPSGAITFEIENDDRGLVLGMVVVYSAVGSIASRRQGRRAFQPVAAWLDAGREPTAAEQEALLAQPRRQATGVVAFWMVGGAIGFVNYLWLFGGGVAAAFLVFAGVTFLGSHAAAFSYLLVERTLRPLAAKAMVRTQPVRLTILSVRNRFLMAFAFGPGITIAGIVIMLTLRDTEGYDLAPAVWPIVFLGLVDGYLLVALAAASVTAPMEEIRQGMKRVVGGDLDVEVPIDAGSEVGLLQVGFNQMVGGLRERERLRQLLGQSAGIDVADQLVEHGVDFEGVELEASVLMIDLVGSTPRTETDAAEVLATLNDLFDLVVVAAREHGGWVNRFVGDAALCVFGAPVPNADHASSALAAARRLRDDLLALRIRRPWLDVGIAVSSGPVIAANVGTADRFEFTVIGDAANEAARLTGVAKHAPARLVASGSALAAASPAEAAAWVNVGDVNLRGKTRATSVWEPLASLAAEVDKDLPADLPSAAAMTEGPPIPKRMVERLRKICLALPETTLKTDAWAHAFQIRRRTFAFLLAPASPEGVTRPLLVVRADELERRALLQAGHPYFAVGGGHDRLGIVLGAETDWTEIGELVTESYRRLAPKKLVALLDDE